MPNSPLAIVEHRSFCLLLSPASLSHSEWQTYPSAYQLLSSICCHEEMAEHSLTMTSTSFLSTFRCIPSDPIDLCSFSLFNSSQSSTLDNVYIPESAIKVRSQGGFSAELTCEDRSKGRTEFLSLFPHPVSLESLPPHAAGLHSPCSSFYCHWLIQSYRLILLFTPLTGSNTKEAALLNP